MKRFLLSMALLGVLVPSCVKNDPEFTNNEVIIGFDSPMLYTNNNTKVSVFGEYGTFKYGSSDYTYPQEEKIKIFAVEHTNNFTKWSDYVYVANGDTPGKTPLLDGVVMSYDQNLDSWVPKKSDGSFYYFQGNHKLSYAAMSPANLKQDEGQSYTAPSSNPTNLFDENYNPSVSFGDNGLSIENFRVSNDPSKHFELLYSELEKDKTPDNKINNADYYSGLPINFKHALSSIHFSLVKDLGISEDIVLTSVELHGVQCKGNFVQNMGQGADGKSNPTWTLPTSAESIIYNFSDNYAPYINNIDKNGDHIYAGVHFPSSPQYISSLLSQAHVGNEGKSYPLLVIPQPLSNLTLKVNYTVGGTPTGVELELKDFVFTNAEDSNEQIQNLLPGHRYTFRLNYSTEAHANNIIYFSPSTEKWPDAKIIQIDLK